VLTIVNFVDLCLKNINPFTLCVLNKAYTKILCIIKTKRTISVPIAYVCGKKKKKKKKMFLKNGFWHEYYKCSDLFHCVFSFMLYFNYLLFWILKFLLFLLLEQLDCS
jgi:hypothetical protein